MPPFPPGRASSSASVPLGRGPQIHRRTAPFDAAGTPTVWQAPLRGQQSFLMTPRHGVCTSRPARHLFGRPVTSCQRCWRTRALLPRGVYGMTAWATAPCLSPTRASLRDGLGACPLLLQCKLVYCRECGHGLACSVRSHISKHTRRIGSVAPHLDRPAAHAMAAQCPRYDDPASRSHRALAHVISPGDALATRSRRGSVEIRGYRNQEPHESAEGVSLVGGHDECRRERLFGRHLDQSLASKASPAGSRKGLRGVVITGVEGEGQSQPVDKLALLPASSLSHQSSSSIYWPAYTTCERCHC